MTQKHAWISAAAGVVGAGAAVAALFLSGGGNGNNGSKNGPQYDQNRAEQVAEGKALAQARSLGVDPGSFAVTCNANGPTGDTVVWNCDASTTGGQCGGTVVIALDSSGFASVRQNDVACGE
jgi:hypothetical protein